jgi:hypothetical protein
MMEMKKKMKKKISNLNTNTTNTPTTLTEDNTMNLFADIALPVQETKSPMEWNLEDCKRNLKVIFRECSDPDCFIVSINLGGLTSLKVFNGKTTFKMKKDLLEKSEILARVIDHDSIIEEARERVVLSLRKAKKSREAKHNKKQHIQKELNKQKIGSFLMEQNKVMNKSKMEELKDKIDLANLSEQIEKIESDQAIAQSLSI